MQAQGTIDQFTPNDSEPVRLDKKELELAKEKEKVRKRVTGQLEQMEKKRDEKKSKEYDELQLVSHMKKGWSRR